MSRIEAYIEILRLQVDTEYRHHFPLRFEATCGLAHSTKVTSEAPTSARRMV